jgi:hypothetical protein
MLRYLNVTYIQDPVVQCCGVVFGDTPRDLLHGQSCSGDDDKKSLEKQWNDRRPSSAASGKHPLHMVQYLQTLDGRRHSEL